MSERQGRPGKGNPDQEEIDWLLNGAFNQGQETKLPNNSSAGLSVGGGDNVSIEGTIAQRPAVISDQPKASTDQPKREEKPEQRRRTGPEKRPDARKIFNRITRELKFGQEVEVLLKSGEKLKGIYKQLTMDGTTREELLILDDGDKRGPAEIRLSSIDDFRLFNNESKKVEPTKKENEEAAPVLKKVDRKEAALEQSLGDESKKEKIKEEIYEILRNDKELEVDKRLNAIEKLMASAEINDQDLDNWVQKEYEKLRQEYAEGLAESIFVKGQIHDTLFNDDIEPGERIRMVKQIMAEKNINIEHLAHEDQKKIDELIKVVGTDADRRRKESKAEQGKPETPELVGQEKEPDGVSPTFLEITPEQLGQEDFSEEKLDRARKEYYALRRTAMGPWRTKEMSKRRQEYQSLVDQSVTTKIEQNLEQFMQENEDVQNKMEARVRLALQYRKEEFEKVQQEFSGAEKSRSEKLKEWWRNHYKERLVTSGVLLGASFIPGVNMAAIVARRILSGAGTAIAVETLLSKWNEVGLANELSKEYRKNLKNNGEEEAKEKLREKIESFSFEDLQKEINRLTVLAERKGKKLEDLTTFWGKEIKPIANALYDGLSEKMKEAALARANDFLATAKGDELELDTEEAGERDDEFIANRFLDNLNEYSRKMNYIQEQLGQNEQLKAIGRWMIGTAVGTIVGARPWEYLSGKPMAEIPAGSAAPTETASGALSKTSESMPAVEAPAVPIPEASATQSLAENLLEASEKVSVGQSQTVWGLVENKADGVLQELADSGSSDLKEGIAEITQSEGRMTYVIDFIKDKIAANPAEFGLKNIDQVSAKDLAKLAKNEKFNQLIVEAFTKEGLLDKLAGLSQEAVGNIEANNAYLREAARAAKKTGVHLGQKAYDAALAAKEHGIKPEEVFKTAKETVEQKAETVGADIGWSDNPELVEKIEEINNKYPGSLQEITKAAEGDENRISRILNFYERYPNIKPQASLDSLIAQKPEKVIEVEQILDRLAINQEDLAGNKVIEKINQGWDVFSDPETAREWTEVLLQSERGDFPKDALESIIEKAGIAKHLKQETFFGMSLGKVFNKTIDANGSLSFDLHVAGDNPIIRVQMHLDGHHFQASWLKGKTQEFIYSRGLSFSKNDPPAKVLKEVVGTVLNKVAGKMR